MLSNPNIATFGIVVLLIVLAFFLFPAYEHFKDAQGREVDVDPNAPPKPDWLKSTDPRTGEIEEFTGGFLSDRSYSGSYLPSWFRKVEPFENQIPSDVQLIPPVSVPPVNVSSTLGTTPGGTADALSSSVPAPPSTNVVIPNGTASATHMTVPPPTFTSMDATTNGMGADYIKKSSLVPCTCTRHTAGCAQHSGASRSSIIPGDQDVLAGSTGAGSTGAGSTGAGSTGAVPPTNSIEALSRAQNQFNVMKPVTTSFTNDNGVQGFLNSFSAFTR